MIQIWDNTLTHIGYIVIIEKGPFDNLRSYIENCFPTLKTHWINEWGADIILAFNEN